MFPVVQSESIRSLCLLGRTCSGDSGKIVLRSGGSQRRFYFPIFFPSIIEHNQHITLCITSRCTTCLFDTFIPCEIFTPLVLASTSIPSHSYHFIFVVRTFKISSLIRFYLCDTVLLTVITTLYVTFPGLPHLLTGSVSSLSIIFLFLLPPAFGNHHFAISVSLFCLCVDDTQVAFILKNVLACLIN